MSDAVGMEQSLVFGLDIGTRNVVGTVGYKDEDNFVVVAQHIMEHDTRAMLDGQIHDIGRVGRTIKKMKEVLEAQIEVAAERGMYRSRWSCLKDSDYQCCV